MMSIVMILFPIIFGIILPFLKLNNKMRNIYVTLVAIITSAMVFYVLLNNTIIDNTIITLNNILSIGFKIDGVSKIFLMIISSLWPLAVVYATEYMEHEGEQDSFFRYYLIAYGITIGVATSRNLISMYLFYELLTFLTLPLIMHKNNDKSLYAGRIYLTLSTFGASVALIGIILFIYNVGNIEFTYGGLLNDVTTLTNIKNINMLYFSYILCFLGFGVKAAIIPFTMWLPICGVAPTPVSALLHAVAVVKAGVFAIIRVTYFSFGMQFLKGSLVANVASLIAIITILYSSTMAVRDKNIKRRLAYSTSSNLSYILFILTLMTEDAFAAGLTHMVFHAIIKINLFFVAGAILIYANRESVDEVKGIAKKMPLSMFVFLIASLGLIGIPLTCGFVSKYSLITAAIEEGSIIANIGIGAIIISAILTLVYLFNIIINAYIPGVDFNYKTIEDVKEPGIAIKTVLIIITIMIIYFGVNSTSLMEFIENISKGII